MVYAVTARAGRKKVKKKQGELNEDSGFNQYCTQTESVTVE